jgi:chemotaxis signal transduction protein
VKSGVARRRAARRKPAQPANVLVVSVGDRRIAIAARRIIEVARVAGYTSLPCDDASNLGVVVHRDALIPLVDLAPRLGARRFAPVKMPGLCVFVQTELGLVAFPIDRVLGLEPVRAGAPEAVPLLDPAILGTSV